MDVRGTLARHLKAETKRIGEQVFENLGMSRHDRRSDDFARPLAFPRQGRSERHRSSGVVDNADHTAIAHLRLGSKQSRKWFENRFKSGVWVAMQDDQPQEPGIIGDDPVPARDR
jgi:hypothetical protein